MDSHTFAANSIINCRLMRNALFFLITLISFTTFAQTKLSFDDTPLHEVFNEISNKYDIKVLYNKDQLDGYRYSGSIINNSPSEILKELVAKKGFMYIEYNSSYYIVSLNSISNDLANLIRTNSNNSVTNKFEEDYLIPNFILKGKVVDSRTEEPLIGISIVDIESNIGITTDSNGGYTLTLPIGKHTIVYSGIGYQNLAKDVNLQKDGQVNIEMFEESRYIDEVVISGNSIEQVIESNQSGIEILKIETIKKMPSFMGEIDVIKSITSLPGVSTVGEGTGGFNVRGGSVDQNLITLDGIPIYNSSHLFGFFSIFNSDVVNNFTLFKGGIPSKYGGRASSILNVTTKNGDMNRHIISGSLGLISNKLKVEGPIIKTKSSYLLSGRLAHPTWLFKYIPNKNIKKSKASFYDLNLKLHQEISENARLSISNIYSSDEFKFAQDTLYQWTTIGSSIKLENNYDKKSNVLTTMFSNYKNRIIGNKENFEFEYSTALLNVGIKDVFTYYLNNEDILELGIEGNYYKSNNGIIAPTVNESTINSISIEDDNAIEIAGHISFEKEFFNNLSVTIGARYSFFSNIGPGTTYNYANEKFPTIKNRIDSTINNSSDFFGSFAGIEPRANIKYQISNNKSIKFGFNRMRQYMHMITNSAAVAPSDYWKLSNSYTPPIISDQISLGYYQFLKDYAISFETFYKQLDNLIDYRNGATLFLNSSLETASIYAKGRAYGIESKIEKRGKLSGWLSYTYSRSERQLKSYEEYDSGFPEEYYPSNFDKPHNLNVNLNYILTKRLDISTSFVYSTGRPITSPSSAYFINDRLIIDYNKRNNIRTDSYHRLDFSLTLETNLKKDKKYVGSWVFSIYNVYGRKNPFSIYFDTTKNGRYPQAYQLSILGNAFPSIAYNFRLK